MIRRGAGCVQPGHFMKTLAKATMRAVSSRFELGTFCTIALLRRWRPLCGHHPESLTKHPV